MSSKGEEADAIGERLISYLRDRLQKPLLEYSAAPRELLGGYQSSVYQFKLAGMDGALSGPLVLRLNPADDKATVLWESALQNALIDYQLPVARVHFVCTETETLGGVFLIMDALQGEQLIAAPSGFLYEILGKTHAHLHDLDPSQLIRRLEECGIDPVRYGLDSQFDWLSHHVSKFPWIREAVLWTRENRPKEPERLSLCHRDFHGLNLLFSDAEVTGILDWGGLLITDPAFDVANTFMLLTIVGRHLVADFLKLGMEPATAELDPDLRAAEYLAAYRSQRSLDDAKLSYYQVLRCVTVLVRGRLGVSSFRHPLVVADLVACIQKLSGIRIAMPTWR
jgi:aminoglycoside phosphotransferase (APT) family kinase protein